MTFSCRFRVVNMASFANLSSTQEVLLAMRGSKEHSSHQER